MNVFDSIVGEIDETLGNVGRKLYGKGAPGTCCGRSKSGAKCRGGAVTRVGDKLFCGRHIPDERATDYDRMA